MFLQSIDEWYRKLFVNSVFLSDEDEPTITKMKRESSKAMINLLEVLMHTTLYTMGLQPQVNISDTTEHDVVLHGNGNDKHSHKQIDTD